MKNSNGIVDLPGQTLLIFQQGDTTMPGSNVTQIFLIQEAKILSQRFYKKSIVLQMIKISAMEICPKCATPSTQIYDHRNLILRDEPIGNRAVKIEMTKRRFWCQPCKNPFTEPLVGVRKGHRTTERFKKAVLSACETYTSLKQVQLIFRVSTGYIFQIFYQQLELKRRMNNQYPWPSCIGIDEHSFRRTKGYVEFATVFIDFKKSRIFELVDGKRESALVAGVKNIPGTENVKKVVIDMCEAFKNFVQNQFPNASITIDKFHVLRLISKPFSRCRRDKVGHLKSTPKARLLFKPEHKLEFEQKIQISEMIQGQGNENLKEYYNTYQALHRFYGIKKPSAARKALEKIIHRASQSLIKPIKTLSKTLTKWKEFILNYFTTKLTNGKTEGFNNLAKLLQRRAFGFKNFENYRLRLLNACR